MSQTPQAVIEPRQAVSAGNQKLSAGLAARDAAAMASCYTRDGEVLPPGADAARGHAAIRAFWQGAMDLGVGGVTLETVELERQGEQLVEIGRYRLRAATDAEIDHGKYLVTWRLEDGEWRIHRDIWNSSVAQS
jgi:uncharacterized protein (TIGR02246 family)